MFTLEFHEVIHKDNHQPNCEDQHIKFCTICTECGGLCCYPDESTYILGAETTEDKFKEMSNYLTEHRL